MAEAGVVSRALLLIGPSSTVHLQAAALRLVANLALNSKLRRQMIAGGLVPLLQATLGQRASPVKSPLHSAADAQVLSHTQPAALGLLYIASLEEKACNDMANGDVLTRC